MPPKKPPKRLACLAVEKVGEYLLNYCDGVALNSFNIIANTEHDATTPSRNEGWSNVVDVRHQRSFIQDRERQAFGYVDEKIYCKRKSKFYF